MKNTLQKTSIGYLTMMIIQALILKPDFIWWTFQIVGYILGFLGIVFYYKFKAHKESKKNKKTEIINEWNKLKS